MELGPKIRLRGRKIKSIRFATAELEAFREEMQRNPRWAEYATATDSEMLRIALIFGRLHVKHHEETFLLTLEEVNQLVDAAVRLNIGEVARALGGVAQMNADKTITVMRPGADSAETFKAKPVPVPRPKFIQ